MRAWAGVVVVAVAVVPRSAEADLDLLQLSMGRVRRTKYQWVGAVLEVESFLDQAQHLVVSPLQSVGQVWVAG